MLLYTYRCLKCGYEFLDKGKEGEPIKELPKKCPNCRSLRWNELNRIVSEPAKQPAKPE